MIYNINPAHIDLFATEGDSIDLCLCFNCEKLLNAVLKIYTEVVSPPIGQTYNPNILWMTVRRKDRLVIKSWRSDVSPAQIIITGNCIEIQDQGFNQSGFFDYDLEDHTSGGLVRTIMRGQFIVKRHITP